MSPIPSIATAIAFSPAASSIAFGPGTAGQPASVTSHRTLWTGGFLFAALALVSLAGYFYHGRRGPNGAQRSNTWASFTGFLSSMRPSKLPTAAGMDSHIDVELGFENHVSMVYARYFHPTLWNLVERHPGTPSAPAIYVEEETNEAPAAEPMQPGMNSFLDMDEDEDKAGRACKMSTRKALPPYDASSVTSLNFSSEIIGTTVRPGAFLCVPGQVEEVSSEDWTSDSELGFASSPCDRIMSAESDSDVEFSCSPYWRTMTTSAGSGADAMRCGATYFSKSLDDAVPEEGYGLVATISRPNGLQDLYSFVERDMTVECAHLRRLRTVDADERSVRNRRHGIADATNLSRALNDMIPYESCAPVPTISRPSGLCDLAGFEQPDTIMSLGHSDNIGVHGGHESLADSSDTNASALHHEGPDLMRQLLAELRDPSMDITPRSLSEDSDSEHSGDDADSLSPELGYGASLESTSAPDTENDGSSSYALGLPLRHGATLCAPDDHEDRVRSPSVVSSNMSPMFLDSPPSLPRKAYIRLHRDNRWLYDPLVPVRRLSRL